MNERVVTLDVRPDIREGREPFTRIMSTAASLGADQALLLIAPFEPVPLYRMLGRQGFCHQSKLREGGDWEVLFTRNPAEGAPPSASETLITSAKGCSSAPLSAPCAGQALPVMEVDARGLEPPQPLVAILEALTALPDGAELLARTDRRPMHLYAQLEERGFVSKTEVQADGSFITLIRHGQRG